MRRPLPTLALASAVLAAACTGDDTLDYGFGGLSEPVEVVVDDRGVPHIYASNDVDLMFAAGHRMAVDRLFQMDLMRRRALGRRAEVLGESVLGDDQIIRRVNIPRLARLDLEALTEADPELRRMLEAWVAGVNARIAEVREGEAALPYGFGPDELDYEPEPWTVEDAMAVPKLILFGNGSNLEFDILATVLDQISPDFMEAVELPRPAHPHFTMPPDLRPAALAGGEAPLPQRDTGDATDATGVPLDADARQGLRRLLSRQGTGPHGSNNWAVAGEHTADGRPILAGDPHQPLESPNVFYVHHLNSKDRGGTIDAAGWSFAGAPLVHIGRTPTVVWTATTNFADQMDVFSVETVGDGPDQVEAVFVGGEEHAVETRQEVFQVRSFAEDGTPQPLDQSTEHTTTMLDVPGQGVLLDLEADMGIPEALVARSLTDRLLFRWVGFRGTTEALAWLGFNRAESVGEVEEALDEWSSLASFNWIASDAQDITYRVRMDIPDRDVAPDRLPTRVMDGSLPEAQWTGAMLPPEQLPAARNPARGYLATANNDPWGFTADGDITNDPWYFGGFYASGYRARRIDEELERLIGEGPVTEAQMQTLQLDVHSLLADVWVPLLQDAWAAVDTDDGLEEFRDDEALGTLVDLLGDWNRRFERESPGALAFHLYAMYLGAELLQAPLGTFLGLIMNADAPFTMKFADLALRGEYPQSDTIVGEDPHVRALTALDRAAAWLEAHVGGVDPAEHPYTFGDAHGTLFSMAWNDLERNDLALGFVPTRGGIDTVNPSVAPFFLDDAGNEVATRFESRSGPVYRMVATFGEDGRARMTVNWPPGNVADPASPHFDDMLDEWVEGGYRLFPFERDEVDTAALSSQTLPAGMGGDQPTPEAR